MCAHMYTHVHTERTRVRVGAEGARSRGQELCFGVPVSADSRGAQDKSLCSSGSNFPRETTGSHEIIQNVFSVLHSANMYASCQMYTKYVIYIYLEYIKNEHKFRFFCVLK